MRKSYTEDDVIRYIYNETGPLEREEIAIAIKSDLELCAFYKSLKKMNVSLEELRMKPDPSSIKLILEFSQSLSGRLETSR